MGSAAAPAVYRSSVEAGNPNLGLRAIIRRWRHLHDAAGLTDEEWRARRRRRAEAVIYSCWGLIVIKAFVVVWAVRHFGIPFNPMWVIAPTVAFGLVATAAYYRLRD